MGIGLLENHDIILRKYKTKMEEVKEWQEKGEFDNARACEFFANGIAYAYSQIFDIDIDKAKPIGEYKKDMRTWEQR